MCGASSARRVEAPSSKTLVKHMGFRGVGKASPFEGAAKKQSFTSFKRQPSERPPQQKNRCPYNVHGWYRAWFFSRLGPSRVEPFVFKSLGVPCSIPKSPDFGVLGVKAFDWSRCPSPSTLLQLLGATLAGAGRLLLKVSISLWGS